MTNAQVFQAFASREAAQGSSVRSEALTKDTAVLYSYGTPIAINNSARGIIFDVRRYSVTTNKQQAQARAACGEYHILNHGDFRRLCNVLGINLSFAR